MKFASVCSGIEAASVAWHDLGFQATWLSEIEPFPSALLAQRFPQVENLGDMTQIAERIRNGEVEAPDILVGGTPCQAFSVAGLRGGLSDHRGQLTLAFADIANAIDEVRVKNEQKESIIIWENVPGVLSSKDNAFGCFLGALCGESEALQSPRKKWANAGVVIGPQRTVVWRILDAQFFGVAQRRRRVFVVASGRKDISCAEILFEREGVQRDTQTSASARENLTATAEKVTLASGKSKTGTILANCGDKQFLGNQEAFSGDFFVVNGRQDPIISDKALPIGAQTAGNDNIVAIAGNIINRSDNSGGNGVGASDTGIAYTLQTNDKQSVCYKKITGTLTTGFGARGVDMTQIADGGGVIQENHIRRLTPVECERLQGFPDNWTQIKWRGKDAQDCPDSHRYKAIGNSMAVPVMRWIGERIGMFL